MTNLVDVGIRPSNISRVVNAMKHGEGCEEVSSQQVINFIRHQRNNIARSLYRSSNIFNKKQVRSRIFLCQ